MLGLKIIYFSFSLLVDAFIKFNGLFF